MSRASAPTTPTSRSITQTQQFDSQLVTVCVGKDLTVSKTAAGNFDRTYNWLIDKSVDDTRIEIAEGGQATFNYGVKVTPNGFTDSGWTLSGTISVTNPNDWQDITANVTDTLNLGGGAACTVTNGTGVVIPKSGAPVVLNYSCTFTSQPNFSGLNTATATWDQAAYFTPSGSASGTAPVTLVIDQKTNETINVVDDKTTPGASVALGSWKYSDGEHTFTYSLTKSGVAGTCTDYTNTATITQTQQSDSQLVTVCVGKDLVVSKTATGSFGRVWGWDITKDTDASYDLLAGESVSHQWVVTVTPDPVDEGWALSGTISVTNPNDWQDITADVTDSVNLGGGAVCTVTGGQDVVIPKGGTPVVLNYACTFESKPAYSGINTATATWDKATSFTPSGTAQGTANATLTLNPDEVNKTINVDDDRFTPDPAWTTTGQGATWTYDETFACPTDLALYEDGVYTLEQVVNTATIRETGADDDATVDLTCYAPVVSKTAVEDFTRTWNWEIVKEQDATYNLVAGDSVTHPYSVDVTPTPEDNFWTVSGEITVTNGHPTEAMTLTGVSDLVAGLDGDIAADGRPARAWSSRLTEARWCAPTPPTRRTARTPTRSAT